MMKLIRHYNDLGINGMMARWYDKNSRNHRIEEFRGYAREAEKHIKEGDSVLEVAPGPGYLAIELSKLGLYRITGLDISKDFVDIAQRNAKEAGARVEFRQGNAADIPFKDNMFNFIICTAAFKNFREPLKVLYEMYRVLKPGGTALIIDMKRNISGKEIDALVKNMKVKGIEALFMKLTFKLFLKKGAYARDELISLILKTAFKKYDIKEANTGFYIYLNK